MKHYKIIEKKFLKNEQANAIVLEHINTKAKIFVMSNNDNNKTFGIGFRTPPFDNSGVCHILEHSVLNGSKKYKTKEPFMDLVKGSLQTFLNAMTYPDKTLYPVASRNDKDFKNLTDIYLDAVFNPRVLEDERIFKQEGWRITRENDNLIYKGVVYNEMKGAMSSLESQVYKNLLKELFPDTIYGLNSGGDPYYIPTLTYEKFLKYYKEFYHPSNSYIFLYGDMNYESYLEYIHNEYFSKYNYKNIDSSPHYQNRFNETRETTTFINTNNNIKENESFISYSLIIGDGRNSKDRILSDILSSVIIDNESSPFRQKLLSLGILDVIFSASSYNLETTFSIVAKNIDIKNKKLFVKTIEDGLKDIVNNGIDKEIVLTELNDYKFDLREKGGNETKGISYINNAFDSWLYDKSPIDGIDIYDDIEYIEKNIDNNLFENYIKKNILENPHKSIVCHIPKKDLNKNKDKEIQKKLSIMFNELSEENKEKFNNKLNEMKEFQDRENTPEEKATIPLLSKDDVDTKINRINRLVKNKENYTLIEHNLPTSGIDYLRFLFDINHIGKKEDILYLSLLSYVLSMLDTKNYSYSDLNKKIYLNTGGISFTIAQYTNEKTLISDRRFVVATKNFSENIKKSLKITLEVIQNSLFSNENRIKEIISMITTNNEMRLYQDAHILMMNRAISNHIETNKFNEYISGIDFYLFIKKLKETPLSTISKNLEKIYNKVFSKNNLIINVASDFTNKEILENSLDDFANSFKKKNFKIDKFDFKPKRKNEGFATSADVNYVCYGNTLQGDYDSKFVVLNNLISTEYLYNEIRAKSGAYGAGITTSNKLKSFATYSYRDPNLENTLNVYNNIPNFLRSMNLSNKELLPYIIGSVGKLNPPMTERQKSKLDLSLYMNQKNYESIDNMIKNALDSDVETLKSYSNIIEDTLKTSSLAILGNKETIEKNKEKFDEIIEL